MYVKVFKIVFAGQGVLNVILRIQEPAFYQIMGRSIVVQCFKRKVEAIQSKIEDKSDKNFTKRANRFAARYSVTVNDDNKGLTARPISA